MGRRVLWQDLFPSPFFPLWSTQANASACVSLSPSIHLTFLMEEINTEMTSHLLVKEGVLGEMSQPHLWKEDLFQHRFLLL